MLSLMYSKLGLLGTDINSRLFKVPISSGTEDNKPSTCNIFSAGNPFSFCPMSNEGTLALS